MIKFRLAKETEIMSVFNMCESIKKNYSLWDDEYPIYDNFYESYEEGGLYVLEVDGEIVGSISIEISEINSHHLCFSRFMVDENHRRKGYGRKIFELSEKEVLKRGYDGVDILVRCDHPFGFEMYKGFGYENRGKFETSFCDNITTYYCLLDKELKAV